MVNPVNKLSPSGYPGIDIQTREGDSKKFHDLVQQGLVKIDSEPNGHALISRLGQAGANHNEWPTTVRIVPAASQPAKKFGGLLPTRNYTGNNQTLPARADNASNGEGSWSAVRYNPKKTETPDGERPPWVGLGHELTHAMRNAEGTSVSSSGGGEDGRRISEHRATGIGDYSNEPLSENGIRQEHGLPERTNYSGV